MRLFARLAIFLTLLLTLPVFLIRAQPYNDATMSDLLTPPPDCYAPCFMGIVPGGTTVLQALDILEAHQWVAKLRDGGSITWTWSGQQPQIIPSDERGFISSFPTSSRQMVAALSIPTRLRYGDLLLPPADCPQPCFLGVRPGQTSTEEAIERLLAHPFVSNVEGWTHSPWYDIFLQDDVPGLSPFLALNFRAVSGTINNIMIETNEVALGDLWLTLGQAGSIVVYDNGRYESRPLLVLFPEQGLFLYMTLQICTLDQQRFWREPGEWVAIIYPSQLPDFPHLGLPELERIEMLNYRRLSLSDWVYQLRQLSWCRGRSR